MSQVQVVNMVLGGWFRQRWLENILSINYGKSLFNVTTKDKSCTFVSLGQDVGARMEAVHEALWKGGIYPPDVVGYQGIVEPVGRRWYFDS